MLVNTGINITLDGNIQQVSSSGIDTPKMVFYNNGANTVYIGHTDANNAAPSTLDNTHNEYQLLAGQAVTVGQEDRSFWLGENYILSHWYVKGTAAQTVHVTYVARRNAATPS